MDIRDYCTQEKTTLWNETMRFSNPNEVFVDLSDKLYNLKRDLFMKMR